MIANNKKIMFYSGNALMTESSDKDRSGSELNKNPKWIGRSWGSHEISDRLGREMKNTRGLGWIPANKDDCPTILEEVGTHPDAIDLAMNSGVRSSLRGTDFSAMTMGEFSEFVTSARQTRSSTRNTEIFAIHDSNSSTTTIVMASSNTSPKNTKLTFDEESSDEEEVGQGGDFSPREKKRRRKGD